MLIIICVSIVLLILIHMKNKKIIFQTLGALFNSNFISFHIQYIFLFLNEVMGLTIFIFNLIKCII